MNRFEGKVALVTGAGSQRGIGRGTALALAREGAKVVITDIVPEGVKQVVAELNEISYALGEVEDVRNKAQMDNVIWRQRRMGVEPTEDRAERPPSRFEDGETHRSPYTSICCARIVPLTRAVVKRFVGYAPL